MKLNPYLSFNGNCREALNFYQGCLGGVLVFQTIGESPLAGQMPQEMKEFILHASLTADKVVIMGTDMVGRNGLIHGNAVSLMLDCDSEADMRRIFDLLAESGTVTYPIELAFFGAFIGNLTDRYGHHWMLYHLPAQAN